MEESKTPFTDSLSDEQQSLLGNSMFNKIKEILTYDVMLDITSKTLPELTTVEHELIASEAMIEFETIADDIS